MRKLPGLALSLLCLLPIANAKDVSQLPIALWPRYEWMGTDFERLASERLRQGDYLITSYYVGTKDGFRSSRYYINPAKVLIEIPTIPEITHLKGYVEARQHAVGGYFIRSFDPGLRFNNSDSMLKRVKNYADENRRQQFVCLDYATARALGNLKALDPHCNRFVLFPERALTAKRNRILDFIESTAAKLEGLSPENETWLAFALRADDNDPIEILRLLEDAAPLVDGFVLVFDYSDENVSTATSVLTSLRPDTP